MKKSIDKTKRHYWIIAIVISLLLGTAAFSSTSFAQGSSATDSSFHKRPHKRPHKKPRKPGKKVPELNPGQLGVGLLLTVGGVLVMTGRQRKDQDQPEAA